MAALSDRTERKLKRRQPLAIDPRRPVAVKRGVHEVEIGTDAATFAAALRDVLREEASFGLIDIKRAPDRVGRDFAVGERFHGCLRLERLRPWLARLGRSRLGTWLEDRFLSDYAEVVEMEPFRVVYRYLSGTPMAGSSTLLVEPLGPDRCRFRVVFEWQERGGLAISALHRFGIQMHDQATWIQASRAAARAGAPILGTTIPYRIDAT